MKLAVHVTTMNRPETLLETLRAAVALSAPDVETDLTIVDNGSTDEALLALLQGLLATGVRVIRNPTNLGLSRAVNQGLAAGAASGADVLIHLDDDCVKPGTLIKTKTGYRAVETIKPGDLVLTHTGAYKSVEACVKKPFDGEFHRFSFQHSLELHVSHNHPIYAATDTDRHGSFESREWIWPGKWERMYHRAVTIIEKVDEKSRGKISGKEFYYERRKGWRGRYPLRTWYLNNDAARFVGRFLADGHVGRPIGGRVSHHVEIAFNAADTSIDWFKGYLEGLGIPARVLGHGANCRVLHCSSQLLWTVLSQCYDESREKQIPQWAARFGKRCQRHMLKEWLAGDGWQTGEAGLTIGATTSRKLALGMRDVAWSVGWYAGITPHRRHRYEKPNKDQYWVYVRTRSPKKACIHRLSPFEIGMNERVHEVYQYSGVVYNLRVAEDRSFVAEGIVVHNCLIRTQDWDRILASYFAHPRVGLVVTNPAGVGIPKGGPIPAHVVKGSFADTFVLEREEDGPPYREVSWGLGMCFAIRRETYEVVGGMDPQLAHQTEVDLAIRVRLAGYEVAGIDTVDVLHNDPGAGAPKSAVAAAREHIGCVQLRDKWAMWALGQTAGYGRMPLTLAPHHLPIEQDFLRRYAEHHGVDINPPPGVLPALGPGAALGLTSETLATIENGQQLLQVGGAWFLVRRSLSPDFAHWERGDAYTRDRQKAIDAWFAATGEKYVQYRWPDGYLKPRDA